MEVVDIKMSAEEESVGKGKVGNLMESSAEVTSPSSQDENELMQTFLQNIFTKHSITVNETLNQLSKLVTSSNSRCRSSSNDRFNSVSILAQSIRGYLRLLNNDQISTLLEDTFNETKNVLSSLFGIENGYSYFHDIQSDGLLRVCKLALYMKFTKYASDGFTALYTRPPVIYISGAAPANFGKDLRTQLGLPQSSICKVPCNTMFGSPYTMDVAAFERLLTDDVSCGKTPLILIAYAGTPVTGHTDNLSRLREICTQSGVWLHIEGDSLATLALSKVPQSISAAHSADSFTLNLPDWFGTVNIPYCTTYRTSNPVLAENSGLVPKDNIDKLTCLPLWMLIKSVGLDQLRSCIVQSSDLAQQLSHRIDMVSGTKRLEQSNVVSPMVIFKYKASPLLSYSSSNSLEDEDDDESPVHENPNKSTAKTMVDVSPRLCDALNEILSQRLQEACKEVEIKVAQVSREGSCIAFNPLQSSRAFGTGKDDIDQFVEQLEKEIVKLDSTLISRSFFEEAFQSVPDVVVIDSSDNPVVGAFQCIPKYWKVKDKSNLSDSKKKEANDLNKNMLIKLSQEFSFLNEGKTSDGQIYIQIGVIDDSFDVNELSERVKLIAEELEDNSKFLESMSDAVQKSIHEAEAVLQKESEEKFFEEGVLRHVPLIGSVFSWLSPPPKESHGVTGRAFNLASGKLLSTEKTYRYKMQLQGEDDAEDTTQESSTPGDPAQALKPQMVTQEDATQSGLKVDGEDTKTPKEADTSASEADDGGKRESHGEEDAKEETSEQPEHSASKDNEEATLEKEVGSHVETEQGDEVKESDV